MGVTLDKPVTEKHTEQWPERDSPTGLGCGLSCMQGWRRTMEDAHHVVMSLPGRPNWAWFGVFDGHGGDLVANLTGEHLLTSITAKLDACGQDPTPPQVTRALQEGFMEHDVWLQAHEALQRGDDHSGCTATTLLLSPTHLFVANCGDSRTVVSSGPSHPVWASIDHKPTDDAEKRRIVDAGCKVFSGRVNGDLAVSRALGDFGFKMQPNVAPELQPVSPMPEVTALQREAAHEFAVLACDGVWDVMSSSHVVDLVRASVLDGEQDLGKVAEVVIDQALKFGSRDNLSCCVVMLPGASRPTSDAVKRREEVKRQEAAKLLVLSMAGTFHESAERGDLEAMEEALESVGPGVAVEVDEAGQSSMHHAAMGGHVQALEWLAIHGAMPDIQATDKNGRTPLLLAAGAGHVAAMRWLVRNGAAESVTTRARRGLLPMHAAAAGGFVDVMEFLRQQCEGDAEAGVLARKDGGVTPMHLAARCGSAEAMDWLYQHGGKPRAKTEMGRSVMHDAAEHGSVRVLEWLRVHGARADISSRESRGWTPLEIAAANCNDEAVAWLLDCGASTLSPATTLTHLAFDVVIQSDYPAATTWLMAGARDEKVWQQQSLLWKLRAMRAAESPYVKAAIAQPPDEERGWEAVTTGGADFCDDVSSVSTSHSAGGAGGGAGAGVGALVPPPVGVLATAAASPALEPHPFGAMGSSSPAVPTSPQPQPNTPTPISPGAIRQPAITPRSNAPGAKPQIAWSAAAGDGVGGGHANGESHASIVNVVGESRRDVLGAGGVVATAARMPPPNQSRGSNGSSVQAAAGQQQQQQQQQQVQVNNKASAKSRSCVIL